MKREMERERERERGRDGRDGGQEHRANKINMSSLAATWLLCKRCVCVCVIFHYETLHFFIMEHFIFIMKQVIFHYETLHFSLWNTSFSL